jgi:hypothetical protein
MSILNAIPDYDGDKSAIPTAGENPLLENDVRIDNLMKHYMDHPEIVVLNSHSWGSEWWNYQGELSSSSSPTDIDDAYPDYPMASIEVVDPTENDELIIDHWNDQMLNNGLPGTKNGPAMTSRNYMNLSSMIDKEIPGDVLDETSSSTSI